MNFQDLVKVEKADFYLEQAFKNSKKAGEEYEKKFTETKKKNKRLFNRRFFQTKGLTFKKTLIHYLQHIETSFPQVNELPEFYLELCKITIDVDLYKKSLGSLRWAWGKIDSFHLIFEKKLKEARDFTELRHALNEFMGRVSSLIKQIADNLESLDVYRKELKGFPTIKTGIFTICIAGFPNVGKSTLLSKITNAKPEIKDYPFTTKSIQMGYLKEDSTKIQFIDTPGALNRPLDKMNIIEKQAFLVFKHLANAAVFIFDPTLHSGFNVKEQVELFKSLKERFNATTWIIVVNKIDMKRDDLNLESIKSLPHDSYFEISAKDEKGLDELKEKMVDIAKKSKIVAP